MGIRTWTKTTDKLRRVAWGGLALLLALAPQAVAAEELLVVHELLEVDLQDPLVVRAHLRVTASNASGEDIKNVDLRPAGAFAVAGGVVQLGAIPADGVQTTDAEILINAEAYLSDTELSWILDYDDASGNHQTGHATSMEPSE